MSTLWISRDVEELPGEFLGLIVRIVITEGNENTERLSRLLCSDRTHAADFRTNQSIAGAEQELSPLFKLIRIARWAKQRVDDQP